MINKNTMSVFAIVAIAVMMVASSIAPAYAAKKVFDNNFYSQISGTAYNVCGQTANYDATVRGHITIWDNDKVIYKERYSVTYTDLNGKHIGNAHTSYIDVDQFGDGPQVYNETIKVTCDGQGQNIIPTTVQPYTETVQ